MRLGHHVVLKWGLPTTELLTSMAPQSQWVARNGIELMPEFNWRSPASYLDLQDVETPDIAWECLRHNVDYQRDYDAMIASRPDRQVTPEFRRKWGICFRP